MPFADDDDSDDALDPVFLRRQRKKAQQRTTLAVVGVAAAAGVIESGYRTTQSSRIIPIASSLPSTARLCPAWYFMRTPS